MVVREEAVRLVSLKAWRLPKVELEAEVMVDDEHQALESWKPGQLLQELDDVIFGHLTAQDRMAYTDAHPVRRPQGQAADLVPDLGYLLEKLERS